MTKLQKDFHRTGLFFISQRLRGSARIERLLDANSLETEGQINLGCTIRSLVLSTKAKLSAQKRYKRDTASIFLVCPFSSRHRLDAQTSRRAPRKLKDKNTRTKNAQLIKKSVFHISPGPHTSSPSNVIRSYVVQRWWSSPQ